VSPGETYEIPNDVHLAGEGERWEKAKAKASSGDKE
jgi:hypothetical protein